MPRSIPRGPLPPTERPTAAFPNAKRRYAGGAALALLAFAFGTPVHAQSAERSSIALELTSDFRNRGLSWSDGDPTIVVDGTIAITDGFALDLQAAGLRESQRHGGSDLGLAASPRFNWFRSGWTLSAGATGHVFTGEGKLNYIELDASAAHSIGPLQLGLGASFAPSQSAIGGSNLYLDANLAAGIPGTPFTIFGGAGYTMGSSNGSARAARLRPEGDYADYHVGIEHVRGPLALGLRYSDTSIDKDRIVPSPYSDRDVGSRLIATVRLSS